jgi:hypothetical protein
MISPLLQRLLELRQELQELQEETKYSLELGAAGNQQVIRIAKRAIEIINEWPEDLWPLEDEEDLWPDQETVLAILKMSLDKAKNYRGPFSIEDFDEWIKPRTELTAGLWFFRKEEDTELEDL